MNNLNDSKMKKLIQELDQIDLPKETLQVARNKGLQQFRLAKRKKRNTYTTACGVTILLLLFVTCIRIFPTFAQAVEKIPGFAPLVEMIGYDKGVKDVLKQDYYETLNVTENKNDLKFTLLGTIADESGIVLFYQLEAPYDISKLYTKEVKVLQNGKALENISTEYGWSDRRNTKIIKSKIEIVSKDSISYKNPKFTLNISFDGAKQTKFSIPFTLKHKIEPTKTYVVNKKIAVDGQNIYLKKLNISPLRAEVQLVSDKNNTQQILRIGSIKLIDEKGEKWGNIVNGTIGFGSLSDGKASLLIQSNYFRKPKKLTLVLDKIEALPKGEEYIVVDFRKKEIIQKPTSNKFIYSIISPDTLEVNDRTKDTNTINQFFSYAIDQKNEKIYLESASGTQTEDGIKTTYTFEKNNMKNPVRIYFDSYPHYLNGKIEVNIPIK